MVQVLSPELELEQLADNRVTSIIERVLDLFRAQRNGGPVIIQRSLSKFADVIRRSQALADLLGRRRAFIEFDAVVAESRKIIKRSSHYAVVPGSQSDPSPTIPNVPFKEALDDLKRREPRLAPNADLVTNVYSREHGFALARSASLRVTKKVQNIVEGFFGPGVTRADLIKEISEAAMLEQAEPFARSYAEVVFRTNLNTAFTAGRFQQAADPDISQAMPAFEYKAIRDVVVRRGRKEDEYGPGMAEDHLSLDGMIASTGSPLWQIFAPPNGYNCRCSLRLISIFELQRKRIIREFGDPIPAPSPIPSSEVVHPNFRAGRPDQMIYFGVRR